MSILSSLRSALGSGPRDVIGVDIGTSAVKMVELTRGKQLPALRSYAILEDQSRLLRPSGAIQSSSVKLSVSQLTGLLKLGLERGAFSSRTAIASVPPFVNFTAILDLPQMADRELEQALSFQARQYIPVPLNEVSLQWLKVGQVREAGGLTRDLIMLNAVPGEYVTHCREAFSAAGLTLASLEIEQLALVRGAVGADQTPTMILDIGAQSSAIVVAEGGQVTFAEQADIGGDTVTAAIANSLGLNPVRADAMKREHGIVAQGPSHEIAAIALPAADAILGEVRKAIYTYESRFQKRIGIERVLLTGGGANLRGIEAQLGSALQVPVARAAPLYRVEYPGGLEPLLPELNPTLALAVGLGLSAVA